MEGLFALIAEFVSALVSFLSSIVAGFLTACLEFAVFVLSGRSRSQDRAPTAPLAGGGAAPEPAARSDGTAAKPSAAPYKESSRPRFSRRWLWCLGCGGVGLIALPLVVVAILNVFFFDALVRHLCQRVERASQITVTFQQVRGSLWSGTATLTGTRISRQNHPISDFDLQAQRIDISISPWSWLFGERSFRKILIQEARGDFDRVGTAEQTRRPGLVVGNLGIEDLQLAVSDQTRSRPVAMDLEITKLTCTHFRSNGAAFDLLFRSNWNGRLNDRPVSVTTREIEKGRETHWKGEGLPIEVVGPYLGGPFRWIEQGEVDIDVDDRWSLKKDAEIEMHWDFVFRDLSAKAPEIESPALRAAAAAVVGYLNQHADRVHLGFDLFISPDRFEGNATAEAAGLADVVAAAAVRELAKQTGGDSQQIEHAGRELGTFAVEEFKAFLKRRRDRKQK